MNYKMVKQGSIKRNKSSNEINRKVLPVCFLCSRVPEGGIRNGFLLRGIFICKDCERELINSKPEEKEEEYMLTIAKLRHILFKDNKPRCF